MIDFERFCVSLAGRNLLTALTSTLDRLMSSFYQMADSPIGLVRRSQLTEPLSVINLAYCYIASFRCGTEFGRYRGIADIGQALHRSSSIYEYAP